MTAVALWATVWAVCALVPVGLTFAGNYIDNRVARNSLEWLVIALIIGHIVGVLGVTVESNIGYPGGLAYIMIGVATLVASMGLCSLADQPFVAPVTVYTSGFDTADEEE